MTKMPPRWPEVFDVFVEVPLPDAVLLLVVLLVLVEASRAVAAPPLLLCRSSAELACLSMLPLGEAQQS